MNGSAGLTLEVAYTGFATAVVPSYWFSHTAPPSAPVQPPPPGPPPPQSPPPPAAAPLPPPFQQGTYPTGVYPRYIIAADLDGDGYTDVVTADYGDANDFGTVSVLLNSGGQAFQPPKSYVTSSSNAGGPTTVVAADFNKDSHLDLATQNGLVMSASIPTNNGDATFKPVVEYPVSNVPVALTAADFDGDGNIDFATIDRNDDNVNVYISNGDGTFAPSLSYPAPGGDGPSALGVSDFDGDGSIDLATANQDTTSFNPTICILLNNGNGTFGPCASYSIGYGEIPSTPSMMKAADFDNDGRLDLAVLTTSYYEQSVIVFLNTGKGQFPQTPSVYHIVGYLPTSITAADFDGDAYADLVVATNDYGDGSNNVVNILINNRDGTFPSSDAYSFNLQPSAVAAADFDGDGHIDVALANGYDNSVTIMMTTGNGVFPNLLRQ